MSFNIDPVGEWSEEMGFDVGTKSILAYAAATNDPSPRYAETGIAPPVYAVLPMWEVEHVARYRVVPPEIRPFALHGSQDILIHSPLRAGDETVSRARVIGVHPKSSGTIVTCQTVTEAGGELRNEQYMTLFYRGVTSDAEAGELAPPLSVGDATDHETAAVVDADQTARYAEASGDHNAIHLDPAAAHEKGLPGIICHGLCTMALSSAALIDAAGVDVERVSRVAVRFSLPLLPGQTVRVPYAAAGNGYDFSVEDAARETVLRSGRLETR